MGLLNSPLAKDVISILNLKLFDGKQAAVNRNANNCAEMLSIHGYLNHPRYQHCTNELSL